MIACFFICKKDVKKAAKNHDGRFNSHRSREDMCASLYGRTRCFHHLVAGLYLHASRTTVK